jgi:hypothetical protein
VGQGVGQRGPSHRPEQAVAPEGRSLHLRSDEPPYGEEIGTLVRVFGRFLDGVLRSSHSPGPESLP